MTLEETYSSESEIPTAYRHLYSSTQKGFALRIGSELKTIEDLKAVEHATSKRKSSGLTKKQETFARAVITEDTLSDAYRQAYDCSGMSNNAIHEEASQLNKHPDVALRVAELRDRVEKAADVTLDRWMREQARIAFADPAELYNDNGSLKSLSEMSPDARATIAAIDIESRVYGGGENAEEFVVKKVKLHSKTAALESLGRALGAYEKDNKQKNDIIPVLVNKPDWLEAA